MPATTSPQTDAPAFDAEAFRADFPALQQDIYEDTPLVYLDNAATSQKPTAVIDRLDHFYRHENSNVHRGVHRLSQEATDEYESARQSLTEFINAQREEEVIFTRGTTEGLNLIASTFGEMTVSEDDEILLTEMEHHSNIVPWQMLAERVGAEIRVLPVNDRGELEMNRLDEFLTDDTALVAVTHVSNTLGTINPIEALIDAAHAVDVPVVVDGAQSAPHLPVDVQALDADFFVFSGHKMFGPTGIGILYGKHEHLEAMPPYHGGGDMIDEVSFDGTTYDAPPHKFEAGTPNIADVIGLGTAAEYMMDLDWTAVQAHEDDVLSYATEKVGAIDGLRLIGTAAAKTSVLSFVFDDIHPYDAGTFLDRLGIAVRTGHHCTQPLVKRYGLPGTIRASFAAYNTRQDVDRLVEGIQNVKSMLG
ncbi:cysteine sulfinate desulfinase [Salinibacter sp. 10B]|uniref:aminotransferase class V-fold PLP-dependent enzyme n=1 Tax=Salinibacter sp. 10B TaxID=1923971 RepID=UPI000CF4192A|nr:cysteine desulfurase [Salinibacter sp. 10B]PQJ36135.1 cysteine sulfinate desulfinase [Salinibacter sp. 10B]